jgi:hypothetical protein
MTSANIIVQASEAWPVVAAGLGSAVIVSLLNLVVARKQRQADADRLGQQFAHDRQMREQQQNAEAARLDRQLAHDREMRERKALRDVLDLAMEAARISYVSCSEAIYNEVFGTRPKWGQIGLAGSKLVIRLGRDHPLEARYQEVRESLDKTRWLITKPLNDEDIAERKRRCKGRLGKAAGDLKRFADQAADLGGSPLAVGPREPSLPEVGSDDQSGDRFFM